LSEATPSGHEVKKKLLAPKQGRKTLMSLRRPVVSSLGLLNHRLLAPDSSGIVLIKKCHS